MDNAIYEQLPRLLLSMRDRCRRLGTEDEYTAYLNALRPARSASGT
ncbi:hypothetical protein [Streptomyces sp. NPDC001714]